MRTATHHNIKTVLASLLMATLALLLAGGCAVQEEQKSLADSTPETVDLLVSLGGESRAERFLGTFDEISTLTLDLTRNFDGREVVTGFALARDNVTGHWTGTLNNLIVSFDYTITGHAYKCTNCDNGSVAVENQHHLTWQQQDDGVGRNWSDAAAYCSSLSLAGYSDWWLPSKYQLVSLVDSSYSYPTINTNYFLNTQSTYYWSSTDHYFETPNAWAVGFDYGSTNDSSKTSNKLARCVRTGP